MQWRRAAVGLATLALTGGAACTRPTLPPSAIDSDATGAQTASLAAAPGPAADPAAASGTASATLAPGPASVDQPDPPTTPAARESRQITLAFVGDILPHSPLWRGAARIAAAEGREGYDFAPMLAELRPRLEAADLAVCHLETPIAPAGERFTTAPIYGVPAEIAEAIAAAGFDHCSTASNHTLDRGVAGIDRTVDVLEAAGISQAGMARHPEEIWPRLTEVGGVPVALLSYTWSFNGLPLPSDEPWRSALIDPDRIALDATTARLLGAEVVVVSLHWGAEQVHDVTRYQREVAEAITADGLIDLVVGHHAHVLQPVEQVNGTWVLFGLSNILSNLPATSAWTRASQDAAIAEVTFTIEPDGSVGVEPPVFHPTWIDKQAEWTVRLVADELARPDLDDSRRAVLEASWERSVAVVGDFVHGIPYRVES